MVEDFNNTIGKEKNISVTAISMSDINTLAVNLVDSANKEIGSLKMPNMFLSYAETAYELNKMGYVSSLDDYFTNEELSMYNDDFLKDGRFGEGNHLKIMPVAKSTVALYVNKTDFDKFLVDNPNCNVGYDDLSTIEGIIKIAEEYYNATNKAFYGRDSLSNYFVLGSKELGSDLFDYNESGSSL